MKCRHSVCVVIRFPWDLYAAWDGGLREVFWRLFVGARDVDGHLFRVALLWLFLKFGSILPDGLEFSVIWYCLELVVVYDVELRGDMTRGGVEDERDRSGVMGRVAQVYANTAAIIPFGEWTTIL